MVAKTTNTTPTAEHLQRRRGAVAKALKKYLGDHQLTVRQFNEQLGLKPGSVTAYNWIAGRNLPAAEYVPVLARTLGRSERFFQRDEPLPRESRSSSAMPSADGREGREGREGDDGHEETEVRAGNGRDHISGGAQSPVETDRLVAGLNYLLDTAPAPGGSGAAAGEGVAAAPEASGMVSNNAPIAESHAVMARDRALVSVTRARTAVAAGVGGKLPILSYVGHGNGTATVTLNYVAKASEAHRVFAAIAKLGLDVSK